MCLMAKIPQGRYWECFMEITLPLWRESTPRQTTCLSYSYQTTTALTPVSMLRTMPLVIKRRTVPLNKHVFCILTTALANATPEREWTQ